MEQRVSQSAPIILLNLDTVLIGVAVSFAVFNLVTDYSTISLIASISFFLAAINFYHGKLNLVLDSDYKEYCEKRDPRIGLLDFVFHIITIGSFAFMPFFLSNVRGYLLCHSVMRFADVVLTATILLTIKHTGLSTYGETKLMSVHRYWLLISLVIVIFTLVMAIILRVPKLYLQLIALWGLLGLGCLDIVLDYTINSQYYFARNTKATSHSSHGRRR